MNARFAVMTRSGILVSIWGLVLTACTSVMTEEALDDVNALVEERTRHSVAWQTDQASQAVADQTARGLLSRPLTADAATQLAFLRNPSIQASLVKVGIAQADVAQAGRMKNPVVSIERITANGALEIERQFLFSLLSLLTIGPRTKIAEDQAERVRYMSALDIVSAADGVRRAWIEAVAARERVSILRRMFTSVDAAEGLGMRMAEAGSLTPLDQAKLKVAKAEVAGLLGKARIASGSTREKLIREMGVWGTETKFSLPSRLPQLPRRPMVLRNIEREALLSRLDIQAARKDIDSLQKTVGLTKFTGVVNLLEVSAIANTEEEREDGQTTKRNPKGFEIEFEIPIFDPGDVKVTRAQYVYMQAVKELEALAITARSEVREAYNGYRGAYDLAGHYQGTIVPLNKRIAEEELLRYNGMLASVFELLEATKRQQEALLQSLDARRDFWLAETQLKFAVVAGSGKGLTVEVAAAAGRGGGEEEH